MNGLLNFKILFFLNLIILISCAPENSKESIHPWLSDISESVYASVNVVPEESYFCRSTHSGIIQRIYVDEGDYVKKGQALFMIGPSPEIKNRVQTAKINLNEAKNNYLGVNNLLLNLNTEIQTIKEQNKIDSINLERNKRLIHQNIGSEIEVEKSELQYQSSSNQLKILYAKYAQTEQRLKNQFEIAQNISDSERQLLEEFVVKALLDGKIFSIEKQVGEYINPQENFAEIGSESSYIIEMDIDEVDISKVSIGDTAIIDLEAYPNQTYTSTINFISNKKEDKTQTFKVKCQFIKAPPKLYHGLSGEANIVVDKRKNVIIIPAAYLKRGNTVETSSGEIEVKVGMRNLEYVEILEGIDTSTTLLKPF